MRTRSRLLLCSFLVSGAVAVPGFTQSITDPASPVLRPSYNLYGGTGLIDMPSADMQPDWETSFTYSQFGNTTRRALTFQALPRIEATLRYSTIDEYWFRDGELDDYSDRSFDLKILLLEEGRWRPSVALGLRDFIGTGLKSGEYIAASKAITPDIRVTGGIGWGSFAGEGGFDNPFGKIADKMYDRPGYDEDSEGGELNAENWFRGEKAAFFGGIEWRTPIEHVTAKVEYSPDSYEGEQRYDGFERESDWNYGIEYAPSPMFKAGLYYMYGSEVGFALSFKGNPKKAPAPQDMEHGPLPVQARAAGADYSTAWAANPQVTPELVEIWNEALSPQGIRLRAARVTGTTAEVEIVNARIVRTPKAVGRVARIMARSLPASVENFRVTLLSDDDEIPVSTVNIARSDFESQIDRPRAGAASWQTTQITDATRLTGDDVWRRDTTPDFDWSIRPEIPLNVFDTDEPFNLGLNLIARGEYKLAPGLSVSGKVTQQIIESNTSEPDISDSPLKHVRSDSRAYYDIDTPILTNLTADYVFKLAPSVYGRISGGYFERAFAGVGGEVLWKPAQSRIGIGAEAFYVRARDYENQFSLLDPEGVEDYWGGNVDGDADIFPTDGIATGFVSVYWDTGWNDFEVQLDVGRYLAEDFGATLSVSRVYANGWEVGAWVTKTDVSSEDFGEGSFDKGIILSIPFGWTVPRETKFDTSASIRQLARDGGAKLQQNKRLYPMVKEYDEGHLEDNWGSFWQ
ncbi:YjbH domain-containing protein [Paracoccaceae bacterium GXU_MW_L88]